MIQFMIESNSFTLNQMFPGRSRLLYAGNKIQQKRTLKIPVTFPKVIKEIFTQKYNFVKKRNCPLKISQ